MSFRQFFFCYASLGFYIKLIKKNKMFILFTYLFQLSRKHLKEIFEVQDRRVVIFFLNNFWEKLNKSDQYFVLCCQKTILILSLKKKIVFSQ